MADSRLTPETSTLNTFEGLSVKSHLLGNSTASCAGFSVFVFGLYLVLLGVVFLLTPNVLLDLVALQTTNEIWIRLVGFLLLVLSFYYLMAARTNTREFFRWTIYTRLTALFVLVAFVAGGLMEPIGLIFWLGDLAGAVWTWFALRKDKQNDVQQAEVKTSVTRFIAYLL